MFAEDYFYSEDHEWAQIKDDVATIGISDFAQKQLGDVVYVELPEIGTQLEFHQSIGVVESVKAVSDIYSPLSGEVIAVNMELNESPELINQDPYRKGWIIKLKMRGAEELEKLMSTSEYEKFVEGIED